MYEIQTDLLYRRHMAALRVLRVRPSVCLSACTVPAPNLKIKSVEKPKIM